MSDKYECPICSYKGKFETIGLGQINVRYAARCPECLSLERHRLQWLVVKKLFAVKALNNSMSMLHMAPEQCLRYEFIQMFKSYITADLSGDDVDWKEDLCKLSFPDGSFDIVFASHILEHIKEDSKALKEIVRILAPGGLAILPVPINGQKTTEYKKAKRSGHYRSPGYDYIYKYRKYFNMVVTYSSEDFPDKYQTYDYENTKKKGDIVPVCYR